MATFVPDLFDDRKTNAAVTTAIVTVSQQFWDFLESTSIPMFGSCGDVTQIGVPPHDYRMVNSVNLWMTNPCNSVALLSYFRNPRKRPWYCSANRSSSNRFSITKIVLVDLKSLTFWQQTTLTFGSQVVEKPSSCDCEGIPKIVITLGEISSHIPVLESSLLQVSELSCQPKRVTFARNELGFLEKLARLDRSSSPHGCTSRSEPVTELLGERTPLGWSGNGLEIWEVQCLTGHASQTSDSSTYENHSHQPSLTIIK